VDGLVEFNDTVSVSDLSLPDTVTILSDQESMVAKVEPPQLPEEEEEEEEEELLVSAEPEVIGEATEEEAEEAEE
jgi:large subunit ribosomal protein L25